MSKPQRTLMVFSPSNGARFVEPEDAWKWRKRHHAAQWYFNPWTGAERNERDVIYDPYGILILPPGEPLMAATARADAVDSLEQELQEVEPMLYAPLRMNLMGNPATSCAGSCHDCKSACPSARGKGPEPDPGERMLQRLEFLHRELGALIVAVRGPAKK